MHFSFSVLRSLPSTIRFPFRIFKMDKSTEINLLTKALFRTLTAPEGTIVKFPELEDMFDQNSSPPKPPNVQLVINIFDFDGTLFSSPEPNPAIWENRLIGYLRDENIIFKGWYQDKRSLSFEHQE